MPAADARAEHDVRLRVGIFGGTFDPPHRGHVHAARRVMEQCALDHVLWIPSLDPPHKPDGPDTPFAVRTEMVRAAVDTEPGFSVSEVEAELPVPSYTVQTLEALLERDAERDLFLIIGSDQYDVLDTWKDPERLHELATLLVMRRGPAAREVVPPARGVSVDPLPVSSTEVRARVAAGEPIDALVPAAVRSVMERENLYLADP